MLLSNFPVTRVAQSRLPLVDFDNPGFGAIFSDHMFSVDYREGQWREPRIHPYGAITIEPGVSMLHYGQTVFEGYKVFRTVDGDALIFRPDMNAKRLHNSCQRLCIPIMELGALTKLLIESTRELIQLDHAWIPPHHGQSLYVRPLVIGTEATLEVRAATSYRLMVMTSPVGSYFRTGQDGVSLKVEERYTRAASGGGLGSAKTAANYAASLLPGFESQQEGFNQVLWLDSDEHRFVEEVGAMNIFFKIGGTVVTPPLGGSILPGVVRDSSLILLREWGLPVQERRITIDEVAQASAEGTLEEVFGAGTAAVICPVASIGYRGQVLRVGPPVPGELTKRLYDEITAIQYGNVADRHGWTLRVPIPQPAGAARQSTG
ncbi:MAG: branched-chain amino acid aminotransferase [SAR324 cluster bacterium]|nr:branched-chain amino acid aminotransferase [SAR324 cluster bacterium]